ncbi:MAG: DUF4332 domain-containing protein [Bacteroidales bacterium]|jgi:predicted flap endonuclease-1-like 5' DNA nuclease
MAYKINEIEGIGVKYSEILINNDINTADDLLNKCKTPKGRKELAEATGISEKLILTWTNHADLFRVKGIGPQFAELLEAAGVDTVKELATRVPANLAKKLEEVNNEKKLTRRIPVESEVAKMIEEAKALDRVIEY